MDAPGANEGLLILPDQPKATMEDQPDVNGSTVSSFFCIIIVLAVD